MIIVNLGILKNKVHHVLFKVDVNAMHSKTRVRIANTCKYQPNHISCFIICANHIFNPQLCSYYKDMECNEGIILGASKQ